MRSSLTDDEFEDFLQQQVNDHRMYPSDKLWRNIQTTVHGETRWPALTYISLFIIACLVVSTLLVKPEERLIKTAAAYAISTNTNATIDANKSKSLAANNTNSTSAVEASPLQKSYTDAITQQTITAVNKKIIENQLIALSIENHNKPTAKPEPVVLAAVNLPETKHANVIVENVGKVASSIAVKSEEQAASGKPASIYFNTFGLMDLPTLHITNTVYHSSSLNNDEIWRNFPLLNAKEIIKKKLSKFNFQFYITPSVSYRRLTDAKGKTAPSYTAIPASANYQLDLRQVVKHSPSIGAEVGFGLGYKLSDRLTVKGGLQFNVRQYNIEAYTLQQNENPPLVELTNIAAPVIDSITNSYSTSYNYAQTTSKPIVLRNRYYEIATPVGVDWKLYTGNNGNLTVNIAATLQPTYTFDKEPFAVTTDYKNYADGTSIMRNWNLNSSLEAYISYKMGALTWQVGPQFRYQHLPTYFNYPIREHLLDYGLKIGFTKALD